MALLCVLVGLRCVDEQGGAIPCYPMSRVDVVRRREVAVGCLGLNGSESGSQLLNNISPNSSIEIERVNSTMGRQWFAFDIAGRGVVNSTSGCPLRIRVEDEGSLQIMGVFAQNCQGAIAFKIAEVHEGGTGEFLEVGWMADPLWPPAYLGCGELPVLVSPGEVIGPGELDERTDFASALLIEDELQQATLRMNITDDSLVVVARQPLLSWLHGVERWRTRVAYTSPSPTPLQEGLCEDSEEGEAEELSGNCSTFRQQVRRMIVSEGAARVHGWDEVIAALGLGGSAYSPALGLLALVGDTVPAVPWHDGDVFGPSHGVVMYCDQRNRSCYLVVWFREGLPVPVTVQVLGGAPGVLVGSGVCSGLTNGVFTAAWRKSAPLETWQWCGLPLPLEVTPTRDEFFHMVTLLFKENPGLVVGVCAAALVLVPGVVFACWWLFLRKRSKGTGLAKIRGDLKMNCRLKRRGVASDASERRVTSGSRGPSGEADAHLDVR